jgi:hypothetical protein
MAADYKPELPEGMGSLKINVDHPDYRKLEALAKEEGWTQKSFSRVLGLEASRVMAQTPKPAAAPAPAPAPAKPFAKMSTSEQFAHALSRSVVNRRG